MSRFTSTRPSNNSERFSRRRFLRASVEVGAASFALLPALAARAQTGAPITTTDLAGLKLLQGGPQHPGPPHERSRDEEHRRRQTDEESGGARDAKSEERDRRVDARVRQTRYARRRERHNHGE